MERCRRQGNQGEIEHDRGLQPFHMTLAEHPLTMQGLESRRMEMVPPLIRESNRA